LPIAFILFLWYTSFYRLTVLVEEGFMAAKIFKGFKGSAEFFTAVERIVSLSQVAALPGYKYKDLSDFIRKAMSREAKAVLAELEKQPDFTPFLSRVRKEVNFSVLDEEDGDED
jgi:hypothetical protein